MTASLSEYLKQMFSQLCTVDIPYGDYQAGEVCFHDYPDHLQETTSIPRSSGLWSFFLYHQHRILDREYKVQFFVSVANIKVTFKISHLVCLRLLRQERSQDDRHQ